MSEQAANPVRSMKASEGAKRRWSNAPPGAGRANMQHAKVVGSRKRKAAHVLLSAAEAAIVAAGGEVRWPWTADREETP